jgi:hypothetical protein
MCERHQLSFGLRLESEELHHSAIRTKKELDFGGFFHQLTMRQPIGRQDSMQTLNWIHFCMERLRTLNSPNNGPTKKFFKQNLNIYAKLTMKKYKF